jgi:uncharacterized protein (DUF427 family)
VIDKAVTLLAAVRGAIGMHAKPLGEKVRASLNGTVLAESDRTVIIEHNHYFPSEDVLAVYLTRVPTTTRCWWKGRAVYYDVEVEGARLNAGAWSYEAPTFAARAITGHIAFGAGVIVGRR